MRRARIMKAAEVAERTALAAERAALAEEREAMRRALAEEREAVLEEARARALRDSTRSAMRAIAEAEAAAERHLASLEPQIAAMVAQTVRGIIGALDHGEAVTRATHEALLRLRTHRRARITAAPDVADAVRAGVAAADGSGAEIVSVVVDPRLTAGRVSLSSDRGHAEIGLDDQLAAMDEGWGAAGPGHEGGPSAGAKE